MPTLCKESDCFPDNLFADAPPSNPEERVWWVLHTRPRQEKCLARQLYHARQPFYLPLVSRRWRARGRVLTSHTPLFAGYVFLLADSGERTAALGTRRVVRELRVLDQDRLWAEIRQVYQLIASGMPVTPEGLLGPGTRVEIRSGPLTGLKGVILRTASGGRFVVQVDFIQRGASVLLDEYTLIRAEAP
jgi:transcriptional antiterminator RfaH